MAFSSAHPWAYYIRQAQKEISVTVDYATYLRIPYGQERHWAKAQVPVPTTPCRDCGAKPGQLHVEACCIEACPLCLVGQRLTCCLEGCLPQNLVMEHRVALKQGGQHATSNVEPACPDCLSSRPKRSLVCRH